MVHVKIVYLVKMKLILKWFIIIYLILNSVLNAQSHQTHVHGQAQCNILLDKNILNVEFYIPASYLVGFEHKAQNKEQQNQVNHAIERLTNISLLTFYKKQKLTHKSIELKPSSKKVLYGSENNHDHLKDHHHANYSDFVLKISYDLSNNKQINKLSFNLFSLFQSIHHIKVNFISETITKHYDIESDKTKINIDE